MKRATSDRTPPRAHGQGTKSGDGMEMTYFGRTAVIVRHLRKATNVPLEESGTFPKKISAIAHR